MAKPTFNLKDPRLAPLVAAYVERATVASDIAAARDDSVRPIYALNARTQKTAHIGSGVLLTVNGETLLLSASHVFDAVGAYQLLIGCGDKLHSIPGDRFSTKKGPSGTHRDDPIDVSVFHMQSDIPAEVRSSALELSDLDISGGSPGNDFYVVAGYRAAKSTSTPRGHTTLLDRYPTIEADAAYYDRLNLTRAMHLVLTFEDHVPVDRTWQLAPTLQGVSGGAIFRVATSGSQRARLAATLIERRQGLGSGFLSVAIGTRLGVHFGLIHTYLPELRLDQALEEEQRRQLAKGI